MKRTKSSQKCPKTRQFLFFSLQICFHFQSDTTFGTLLGFSFIMVVKFDMLSFLENIKYKTKVTPRVIQYCIQVCITCLFRYLCWTALFLQISISYEAKIGSEVYHLTCLEDLCHLNDKTSYLGVWHLRSLSRRELYSATPPTSLQQSCSLKTVLTRST